MLLLVSAGTDQETDLFNESAVGGKEGTVPLNLTIFYNSSRSFCFHLFALGGTWEKIFAYWTIPTFMCWQITCYLKRWQLIHWCFVFVFNACKEGFGPKWAARFTPESQVLEKMHPGTFVGVNLPESVLDVVVINHCAATLAKGFLYKPLIEI